jgi:SAM-dependent methyltransferase
MNRFLSGLTRAVVETFSLPGPILEVGSRLVPGQESLANLRSHFPGRPYIGVDMQPGLGVDVVANVESLPQPDESVGTVLALSTFEHVAHFWRGFEEVRRVLRPDGALFVACPFDFHIHAYPNDYWRFTPEALKLLLQDYPSKIIGWHGPRKRPASVWAIAYREGRPAISALEFQQYQARMKAHARMPLSWGRWLRFQVGRLICGRRPFAPFLEQERWECELLNTPPRSPDLTQPYPSRKQWEYRLPDSTPRVLPQVV